MREVTIKELTWARDSAHREIRLLKQEIGNLDDEILRLGRVVDSQNDRYCAMYTKLAKYEEAEDV